MILDWSLIGCQEGPGRDGRDSVRSDGTISCPGLIPTRQDASQSSSNIGFPFITINGREEAGLLLKSSHKVAAAIYGQVEVSERSNFESEFGSDRVVIVRSELSLRTLSNLEC